MAFPLDAEGFVQYASSDGPTAGQGELFVPATKLAHHAMMVGYGPRFLSALGTAEVRLSWLRACLTIRDGKWASTPTFHSMEQSEKSNASFYLGMTMTSLLADEVLNRPYLTHVSTYFREEGTPRTKGKRADFVSTELDSGAVDGLFESKGRERPTGLAGVVADAKEQLADTPIEAPLNLVSVAFFDFDDAWTGYLTDPPGERRSELDPEVIFFARYRPLVEAMLQAGAVRENGQLMAAEIGGFVFLVPLAIFDSIRVALSSKRHRSVRPDLVFERAQGEQSFGTSQLGRRRISLGRDLVSVAERP